MSLSSLQKLLKELWQLVQNKKIPDALILCRQINQQYPESADGWHAASHLAFLLRNAKQSLICIDRALALDESVVLWSIHKAHLLVILGNKDEAKLLLNKLVKLDNNDAKINAELAMVFTKLHDYSNAQHYYQLAISLSPSDAQLYFNLASIERYLGNINKAEQNLDIAIQLNPTDYEAYWLRSSLKTQTEDDNHIHQLKALLDKGIDNPISKVQLCYALAKENEDIGKYTESFNYLEQGSKVRRHNMRYEAETDLLIIDKIIEVFDQPLLNDKAQQTPVNKTDSAIFVLGLPRTGSTLVERIITNHTDVESAGELNDFAVQMMQQSKRLCAEREKDLPKSRSALVELTAQLNFTELGQAYLASAGPQATSLKYFVDKLPLNSLYVGLIHLALPNAKLVHVQRNPLDTCYSIFKQLFTNGYPFSYDLKELADYYIAHYRLMQHWKTVLPNSIYTVRYEDVIANVEQEARELIKICNLDWQQHCSDFHLNKSASVTASATQVRQSVYKSSMGKWRCYESQFSTVKQQLEQAGINCD